MTRKPDDVVGTPGGPAVGAGHQTPQQEALTRQSGKGRSDADRKGDWQAGGAPGRSPPAIGGSSGGHGDQKSVADRTGEKSAAGETRTERTGGKVDW